ncbi:hypothetical protein TrLO_g9202 [Triparma laevis f. longispina]|uniref:Nuclear segregation protein BFR1 n=1 Tax=Triparma laevis f. longispina TaxID=1714387 RepID=A0A9W7FJF3_9STRA|nr:hypothetical protein TrLO_g9202 [Triparma laevis f. longispina]
MAEENEKPAVEAPKVDEDIEVDLSKPLLRVERPSKEKHESDIEKLNEQIKVADAARDSAVQKINTLNNGAKNSPLGAARTDFNKLKNKKMAIMNERKAIFDRRDELKAVTDSLINDAKAAKGGIKYTKIEDIEKRMKQLQTKQETVSMSLQEEKKLIKEIEELSASKKIVAQLAGKEDGIQASKLAGKDVQGAIAEKNQALKEINTLLDAKKAEMDELVAKDQGKRGVIPDLIKERDEFRKKGTDLRQDIRKLRDEFKLANNEWYNYKKLAQARKKAEYEIEKKRREAAWLKEKEEAELKKTPYEEEMALCEYLANYLTTTYLDNKTEAAAPEVEAGKKVTDDPFAGMVAVKKVDENFMKMGGKKQKKVKAKKETKPEKFNISLDAFEQYALINLTPPTAIDQVQASVDALVAKKEWYTQQPRGSVPTANDIRNELKKNKPKSNNADEGEATTNGKDGEKKKPTKKQKAFVFSNDDFAPLSGSDGAVVAEASWGKAS